MQGEDMTDREKFEAWAIEKGYAFRVYDDFVARPAHNTGLMWSAWQAARAELPALTVEKGAFSDIVNERIRQSAQWGGAAHDDTHGSRNWFRFIYQQHEKCREAIAETLRQQDWGHITNAHSEELIQAETRARLVKIAALAIAGIESIDRKTAVARR